jgi:hypothetical protein
LDYSLLVLQHPLPSLLVGRSGLLAQRLRVRRNLRPNMIVIAAIVARGALPPIAARGRLSGGRAALKGVNTGTKRVEARQNWTFLPFGRDAKGQHAHANHQRRSAGNVPFHPTALPLVRLPELGCVGCHWHISSAASICSDHWRDASATPRASLC